MVDMNKVEAANARLVTLSYQMAGILQQMHAQGDIPAWFEEVVRLVLKQHTAAAKTRKEALNEQEKAPASIRPPV